MWRGENSGKRYCEINNKEKKKKPAPRRVQVICHIIGMAISGKYQDV